MNKRTTIGLLVPLALLYSSVASAAPAQVELDALAKKFLRQLEEIHETADQPAPTTKLIKSLKPCQIKLFRPLSDRSLERLFKDRFFAAATCRDRSYVVISLDRKKTVRLVALEPHRRVYANVMDEQILNGFEIRSKEDAQEVARALILLRFLEDVPIADIAITEENGKGQWEGTHYYKAKANCKNATIRSKNATWKPHLDGYEVWLSSPDKRVYGFAGGSG